MINAGVRARKNMVARQRNPQPLGRRGSLKWIQRLVARHPDMLTDAIRGAAQHPLSWTIEWVSPRAADDWSEYRDVEFLLQTGHPELADDLAAFWPPGGPQWDALDRRG